MLLRDEEFPPPPHPDSAAVVTAAVENIKLLRFMVVTLAKSLKFGCLMFQARDFYCHNGLCSYGRKYPKREGSKVSYVLRLVRLPSVQHYK